MINMRLNIFKITTKTCNYLYLGDVKIRKIFTQQDSHTVTKFLDIIKRSPITL